MNRLELADILSAHTDALNSGHEDIEQQLLRQVEPDEAGLPALLSLARFMQETLTPVSPAGPFRTNLSRRLRQANLNVVLTPRPHRRLWLGAAALGSLLSLMGLLFVWLKLSRTAESPISPAASVP